MGMWGVFKGRNILTKIKLKTLLNQIKVKLKL